MTVNPPLVCVSQQDTTSRSGTKTTLFTLQLSDLTAVRSKEALEQFHLSAKKELGDAAMPDFPLSASAFPPRWVEFVPSFCFFASWFGLHFYAKIEVMEAAMAALAGGSLALLAVLAYIHFARQHHQARVGNDELTQYLQRAVELLSGSNELVQSLVSPDGESSRADWPSKFGEIDLDEHDLPHEDCSTEWWYYNSHFQAKDTVTHKVRDFSFFVSFFRIVKHVDETTGAKLFGHAVTWALVDPERKEYHFDVVLDQTAPGDLLKAMERNSRTGASDPMLRRALMDVLRKGNVPLPDRLMQSKPACSRTSLHLDYDGNKLRKDASTGDYVIECRAPNGMRANVRFHPEKAPVRHGNHGVVQGHENEDEDMFYYFIPRCTVTGEFTLPTDRKTKQTPSAFVIQANGQGWYDHEFGGVPSPKAESKMDYAWNWMAIQLDDPKMEVSAATLSDPRSGKILEIRAVVVDEHGTRQQFDGLKHEMDFNPVQDRAEWTSVRTFRKYPVVFRMQIFALGLDVTLDASEFPDQEFMTLLSKPAFWEGRMNVTGKLGSRPVTGLAFFERNGFEPDQTISTFFKNVGVAVRDSVEAMYPLRPTQQQAVELIASENTKHYCDDVPLDILGETLIAPVRLIADRGGKSWRSYAALACVDAVGGDSRKFVQWVAMPEFLHVGSLIVDDIQDKSETRRGGPCAHLIHGEPLAINAGTAAYFQCEQLLSVPGLSAEEQIKCYKLYFAALRGGHAGQALDIYGNDYMMDDVVASGDSQLLEKRICAIHRLKTAVPAGTLARMGCTVGGGSDVQIESVGLFMEAVGVAFQIMDDVLNLRGVFAGKADKTPGAMLKTLGEDIVDGKVTMPVCKYMGFQSDAKERQRVWEIIKSKPSDPVVVQQVIDELERLGAVEACVTMATDIVEVAWKKVDKEIPDSFAKLMLRSFGWYVTK